MDYYQCKETCKLNGYLYFGRQWAGECFCGNSYGTRQSTECDCNLDAENHGPYVNCVYRTDAASGLPGTRGYQC